MISRVRLSNEQSVVFSGHVTSLTCHGTERESRDEALTQDSPVNISYEFNLRKREPNPAKVTKECVSMIKAQLSDFEIMSALRVESNTKVFLARHRSNLGLYALKVMTKPRPKRRMSVRQRPRNLLTEKAVLRRLAEEDTNPFVVKLRRSFYDEHNLYLVMVRPSPVPVCALLQCFDADMSYSRTFTLVAIFVRSCGACLDLDVTTPGSTLQKWLWVSRACTRRVSYIATSNRRTSLLVGMATLCLVVLGLPRSSRAVQCNALPFVTYLRHHRRGIT